MNPNMEPIEDISTSYSNVKECVSINCVGEVLESMDKTLSDSHIKKEYENEASQKANVQSVGPIPP